MQWPLQLHWPSPAQLAGVQSQPLLDFAALGTGFSNRLGRDLQLSVLKSRTHIGIQHTKPLLEQYRGYHVHKCQLCLLSQQLQP